MNQSSRQAWPSLRQGGCCQDDSTLEHPCQSFAVANDHTDAFEAPVSIQEFSEPQHMHHDSYNQYLGSANDFDQYYASDYDLDMERNNLHDPHNFETPSRFAPGNYQGFLRGSRDYAEQSKPGTRNRELTREVAMSECQPSLYMTSHRAASVALINPVFDSMSSPPQFSIERTASSSELASTRQTKYEPFQSRFHTSEEARDHRRVATRFNRTPYNDPASDCSITEIEHNRQAHVLRIYNAMTSGENAKDNRGSIAMKRWVIDAHYPPDLVEAYAHKVFDCLLAQAKEGFRGWVHNDYVADERKGDDIDKDIDCSGRLDNIILALEQEKTICEDVMNSACQIRMFVNAPRAYANRKHQNRVGNSKRGRTKDTPDPNPKSVKAKRFGGRRARARSTTTADVASSKGTTSQHQLPAQRTPPAHPYYATSSHQLPPSSGSSSLQPPHSSPLHRPIIPVPPNSYGQHSTATMSRPTYLPQRTHAPQSHTPRMTFTAPPQQQSPFMSPPPLSHAHYCTPDSPDDIKPPEMYTPWDDGSMYTSVDPVLAQWGYDNLTTCEKGAGTSTDVFGQQASGFVNLFDIERSSVECGAAGLEQHAFGDVWGLQKSPFTEGCSERQE